MRVFTVVCVFILILTSNVHAKQVADPVAELEEGDVSILAVSSNYTGAVVGTLFGFGFGHPFQLRYWETGWKYTVIEAASIMLGVGFSRGACSADNPDCRNNNWISTLAAGVFAASRIFQAYDLWTYASDYAIESSRRVKNRSHWALLPTTEGGGGSLYYSYNF